MPRVIVILPAGYTHEIIVRPPAAPPPVEPPPVEPPPPAAKFRIGATPYPTLDAAMSALQDGQTLDIAPGDYPTDWGYSTANNITIRCVGGEAVFHAPYRGAVTAQWGKSVFVLTGTGVTLANLAGVGVRNSSGNGGLVRYDNAGGTAALPHTFTLNDCRIDNCQTGVLTGNNDHKVVRINRIRGKNNADGSDWHAHAIYHGWGGELYIDGADLRDTLNGGHLIKSRARKTVIKDAKLIEGPETSRAIDIPQGGVLEITGDTYIRQGAVSDNSNIVGYGAELSIKKPDGTWEHNGFVPATIFVAATVRVFDYRMPRAPGIVTIGVPAERPEFRPTSVQILGTYNVGTDPYPPAADPPPVVPPSYGKIIPEVLVTPTRNPDGTIPESWFASLPVRQWRSIAGTQFREQLQPQLPEGYIDYGTNPCDARPGSDWLTVFEGGGGAGGCYRRPYFVGAGGGHFNSSNNAVYELDIRTLKWRWRTQPSFDTYLPEDNVPFGQRVSDYWIGWERNSQGRTGKGAPVRVRFGPRFFGVAYNGDDETRDGGMGSMHTYNAFCLDDNHDWHVAGCFHYWVARPDGTWVKGRAQTGYDVCMTMHYHNGMIYKFGRIEGRGGFYRLNLATGAEDYFNAKTTADTWDDRIGFGLPDVNNDFLAVPFSWVDAARNRLYAGNGSFYADLSHPRLGCTYVGLGRDPAMPGISKFDSSGAHHVGRNCVYTLGLGPSDWGRVFEVDLSGTTPYVRQISSEIMVPRTQFALNRRFFVDEVLDCLFMVSHVNRNIQVMKL